MSTSLVVWHLRPGLAVSPRGYPCSAQFWRLRSPRQSWRWVCPLRPVSVRPGLRDRSRPEGASYQAVPSPVQKGTAAKSRAADGLRNRLPAGTDLNAAAGGFRRLELFVATVHASNNIEIPFSELKRRIVNDGMTLGQAIQDLRPKSRYWAEAQRAEDEAAAAIRTSESVALAADRR